MTNDDPLFKLRAEVDDVDREIVALLAKRMNVVRSMRAVKLANGLPTLDPNRERSIIERSISLGNQLGVREVDTRRVMQALIEAGREAVTVEGSRPDDETK